MGAISLGVSRALQNWEPGLRPPLKEGTLFFMLTLQYSVLGHFLHARFSHVTIRYNFSDFQLDF